MKRFSLAILATMIFSLSFEICAEPAPQFTAEGVATTVTVPIVDVLMDLLIAKRIARDWAVFNASEVCAQKGLNAQRLSAWKYVRTKTATTARATFTCSSDPTNTGGDVSLGY